jgi:molybdopterin/thiamine biosynthesis adenylyltransferase
MPTPKTTTSRYHRQLLVTTFGDTGQHTLHDAHAIIIGCGGLGTHTANILTRMGIGTLDLIDHDTIELTNLHRTTIYTEHDIGKPKSSTLATYLRNVNTDVTIYDHNITVTTDNITTLLDDATIILDGTDSLPLRHTINTAATDLHIPWIYAGVNETTGMILAINPGKTPCFTCLARTLPPPTTTPLPIHGYLPAITAGLQTVEALRILQHQPPSGLLIYDATHQRCETLTIKRDPHCPTCSRIP